MDDIYIKLFGGNVSTMAIVVVVKSKLRDTIVEKQTLYCSFYDGDGDLTFYIKAIFQNRNELPLD